MTPKTAAALRALETDIRYNAKRFLHMQALFRWADELAAVLTQEGAKGVACPICEGTGFVDSASTCCGPPKHLDEPRPTIEQLADRFLHWPLPESVNPDMCVHSKGADRAIYQLIGTHLLTHTEACAMLRYVMGTPAEPRAAEGAGAGDVFRSFKAICKLPEGDARSEAFLWFSHGYACMNPLPAAAAVPAVRAYLKEWTDAGSPRARVDLHDRLDAWMPANTKVTPLSPAAQAQDAGPMARHWREAITHVFGRKGQIQDYLLNGTEQRARALAAKEAK